MALSNSNRQLNLQTNSLGSQSTQSNSVGQNHPIKKSRFYSWWQKIGRVWNKPSTRKPNPVESVSGKSLSKSAGLGNEQSPSLSKDRSQNESKTKTTLIHELAEGAILTQTQTDDKKPDKPLTLENPSAAQSPWNQNGHASNIEDFLKSCPGVRPVRKLGEGGMGIVFEVTDLVGRVRALKVIHPSKNNENLRARFYSEAYQMSQLTHENLVPILEYHEHLSLPYFTMPKYEFSVSELIEDRKIDPKTGYRIFKDAIRGLAYLHAKGYVHRDFKPGNILVDANGRGVLSDFGLIKNTIEGEGISHANKESTSNNENCAPITSNRLLGTIPYLSPETLVSETPKPTPCWDIYAAGITLYELLNNGNRPPVCTNPYLYAGKSRSEAIPPLRKSQPKIHKNLETIINNCCALNSPYKDARDLLHDLNRHDNRWYRRGLALLSILCIGLVTMLIMLLPPKQRVASNTLKDPFEPLYKELAEDKTVDLLDENCKPRFPTRVVIGKDSSMQSSSKEAFTVASIVGVHTYVDLIPNLPHGEYEIRGQFQCLSHGRGSTGGLYVGRYEFEGKNGPATTMQTMLFADSLTDLQSVYTKSISVYLDPKHQNSAITLHQSISYPPIQEIKWRNFCVRLKFEQNEYYLEPYQLDPLPTRNSRVNLFGIHSMFGTQLPETDRYSTEGAFGLIARDCVLFTRFLTIKRLTPQTKD